MGNVIELFKGDKKMTTIFDVANYFIEKSDEENPMTPLKLQKLCYYAQAWSLVWDDEELFEEDFQAWPHGPANYSLYCRCNGFRSVDDYIGSYDRNIFANEQSETLDVVWDAYGKYSGKYLEELTHEERPWLETRGDLDPGAHSKKVITKDLMKEYYSSLTNE